jgi:O-methyltransferase
MGLFGSIKEYAALAKLQSKLARHFPSFAEQKKWLGKLKHIDANVRSAHNQSHILKFLIEILEMPDTVEGCVVEAGAFKGASTAKISLFAAHKKRKVHVFDSFEGLPPNTELHEKSTEGHSIKGWFEKGNFAGSLEEVQANVSEYGDASVVTWHKGWFENTMPLFKEKIVLVYIDVDLAESTKTCLKYLFPLLQTGGAIVSQDGDFPLVINVFKDENFWKNEVGCKEMPVIEGLGKKITIIRKK